MGSEWSELQKAFAAGKATQDASSPAFDRRVEFEDGTVWFPDGAGDPPGSTLGTAALFGVTLVAGMGSLVLFMDSHPWAVASLGPLVLCSFALVMLLRRGHRREKAAEARMERGLFLLPDVLVLRDPPYDKRVSRSAVKGFAIRHRTRGNERSHPWIHVVRHDDESELPLSVTKVSLAFFERWLAQDDA